jgi:hypothetical protein
MKRNQPDTVKLHRDARRYEVAAHRAAQYHARTGEAMYVPGELTRLKRESKQAQEALALIRRGK